MTKNGPQSDSGVRERKRRETHTRIANAAIKLFTANGYDATTLDAIALEAGISRRTFFHYFKSKDDILLSLQTGLGDSLVAALSRRPATERPASAMRHVLVELASAYSPQELLGLDKLMLSSEAVQARKQANYIKDELRVFTALRAHWPKEDNASLRILAMLAIGMTRQSLEAWREEGGTRPLVDVLMEMYAALESVAKP